MTHKRYFLNTCLALIVGVIQILIATTADNITASVSPFLFILALITSGWLLHYFVLGIKHYIHHPQKPPHKPYHIINPVLGVGVNIIVLYLMMQLILAYFLNTSNLIFS